MPVIQAEKPIWCAFCFTCESIVADAENLLHAISVSELHASVHNHMVGITTWIDRTNNKEVQKCQPTAQ